eukprot:1817016-Pyramimonas_sp.AAC.1
MPSADGQSRGANREGANCSTCLLHVMCLRCQLGPMRSADVKAEVQVAMCRLNRLSFVLPV